MTREEIEPPTRGFSARGGVFQGFNSGRWLPGVVVLGIARTSGSSPQSNMHIISAIEHGKRTSDVAAAPTNSILADLSTGLSAPPSRPRFRSSKNLKARIEFFSLRELCSIG